ncbi:type II secretion system protein N [Aquincola sp. S2]|uniref:Type II secretion system protein N n=1 Tax=Pseudaquabacterium terrae TaxID=2732868 RepID=A0ABX2EDB2_9BURK|nr:type II secretion system protein N [Aquabacterium terrae]NRF66582.1 type II secretion system protein N [Aquabacterium terrae]
MQHAARRAALWGVACGLLLGLLLFAPAGWLATALHRASGERLLLADARGSIWSGDAVLVLGGGPGSRDASALPGRLHWKLRPHWRGLVLRARQGCCLQDELRVELRPAWGGFTLVLPPRPGGIGRWPARWLAGLGTPWNTLQLGGTLQLTSPGFTLQMVEGRPRFDGALELQLQGASSTLVPVDPLGSYRLQLRGDAAGGNAPTLTLQTLDGALQLAGSGQWTGARLRFRGDARAAPGQEAALANLLNIIGKRQGALSVISIG